MTLETLAAWILGIASILTGGHCVFHLYQRHRMGSRLVRMATAKWQKRLRTVMTLLYAGYACLFLGHYAVTQEFIGQREPGSSFGWMFVLFSLTICDAWFQCIHLEIRENGIVSPGVFHKWDKLTGYRWRDDGHYIFGLVSTRDPIVHWIESGKVTPESKQAADRALAGRIELLDEPIDSAVPAGAEMS